MNRRREDRALLLAPVRPNRGGTPVRGIPGQTNGTSAAPGGVALSEEQAALLVLQAAGVEKEVAAAVSEMSAESPRRAEAALAAWRDRQHRMWKRSRLPDKLMAFFGELTSAATEQEVCDVVARHAVEIVGGWDAVVVLERAGERLAEVWAESWMERMRRPGLLPPEQLELEEGTWSLGAGGKPAPAEIALVAHVPFGDRGMLLLAERRAERVFDADDWQILGMLAEQGSRAIVRLETLESAQMASLTDPLTGIANRRQMGVVLEHAWAAAERGEGLAVVLLDLDGFKRINDEHGHGYGDQMLRIAADSIHREARGADAVVRYGGDEFLVILPRGSAEGARALARRVRARLHGWVGISAGIAAYHPIYRTPAELIAAADEDLYRQKVSVV